MKYVAIAIMAVICIGVSAWFELHGRVEQKTDEDADTKTE